MVIWHSSPSPTCLHTLHCHPRMASTMALQHKMKLTKLLLLDLHAAGAFYIWHPCLNQGISQLPLSSNAPHARLCNCPS